MLITDKNAVIQGLANIKLESLTVSDEVLTLVNQALNDNAIDSADILELLRD